LSPDRDDPTRSRAGGKDDGADIPARTRAETMGIAPAVGKGTRTGDRAGKDQKRQLEALEEALEAARAEARQAQDNYLREAAELENIRRRHRQEQVERLQYGNAELIAKLLPVVDNFHRALEHAPEGDRQLVDGLLMILRQFEDVLASEGVEPIEALGKRFDPNMHQAVIAEPSPEHEDETITAELQKGYRMRERVLRPSLVKVARNT
jgi:molecular chaperone GrpE